MAWPGWSRSAFVFVVGVLFVSAQAQVWAGPTEVAGGRAVEALLAAAFTLPLLLLRRRPLSVFGLLLAAVAAHGALGGSLGQPWFALLLAVYGLGAHGRAVAVWWGLGALAAVVLVVDVPRLQQGAAVDEVLPAWFILAGTFGFGRWVRARRREATSLRDRAAALERERAAATRAAVAEEQARIARELHDLVAHSLAVIVLQAQAGGRVLDHDAGLARASLESIEHLGRDGLAELRRLLDMLDTAGVEDEASHPGLEHVHQLGDRVSEAGLPVRVLVEGTPQPLPAGLDLSAYRIVQEALTNTLKHAGPARAEVRVRYLPDQLDIRVVDDGARPPAEPSDRVGRGLIGMRERAALYGGTLVTDHPPDGGFRVHASFPLGAT